MALFSANARFVLKGRNANQNINPYTGKVGVYSNWSIFNPSHIFDGAPNTPHTPGTGYHPHAVQLSRRFVGDPTAVAPLQSPGLGPRLTWYHKYSDQYFQRGREVFKNYGHADRETSYSLWDPFEFHGVGHEPLFGHGHVRRSTNAPGTASSFGTFGIYTYKGVTEPALGEEGQAIPSGYDNPYGHNKINEWRGVPSANILG